MVCIKINSGVKVTWVLSLFLLPLGRPGLRLPLGFAFLSFFVLATAFSSSVRTICSTIIGYERRSCTLISESAKNDKPGTARPYRLEKKRSSPYVFLPAFVTTVSSPASKYTSPGLCRC